MEEPCDRLKQIRVNAGFETSADATRSHGWNENTYRSHENGERGIKPQVAKKYARAYRISASWLLTGEDGKPEPKISRPAMPSSDRTRLLPIIETAIACAIERTQEGTALSQEAKDHLRDKMASILEEPQIHSIPIDQDSSDRARTELIIRDILERFFSSAKRHT